jgi:hypothetical protein
MGTLLQPPIPNPQRAQLVALWSSLAVIAGHSIYQRHHRERLLMALCAH